MSISGLGSASSIGMAPQAGSSSVLTPLGEPGVSGGGETAAPATGAPTDATGGASADPQAPAGAAPAVQSSMMPTAMKIGGGLGALGGTAAFIAGSKKLAEAGSQEAVQALTARLAAQGVADVGGAAVAKAGAKVLGMKPSFAKWGGAAIAAAGLGALGMGFMAGNKQKLEQTKMDTIAEYNAQLGPAMQQVQAQHQAELEAMQAQMGGGAVDPAAAAAAGADPAAAGAGADPAAAGAPAAGSEEAAAAASMTGGEAAPMIELPNVPAAGAAGATAAGAVGAGASALVGSTIDLAAGVGTSGAQVAEAGTYAIAQDLGSFATLDEANAAVRATMDPDAMGTRYLRYAVVQSGNSFHAVVAKALEGEQPKPLTAAQGQVVAWNALGHVSDSSGNAGWQAYSWSAQGGATSVAVPYGEKPFPSGVGATTTPAGATTQAGTAATTGGATPVGVATPASTGTTGGLSPVAGGGAVAGPTAAGAPFDPNSVLGRTFSVNASTTTSGAIVSGGAIQLQGFVASSTGGFGTAEQAAVAARQARASLGAANPYARVVTMQGADNRFYVYQASVVARETAPLQNAAPMHVFGAGVASYYDGATSAWQSIAD